MCTKIFNKLFISDKFYTNSIRGLVIFIFSIASFALTAQQRNIIANNDTIRTGPLEKVKKNILINDIILEDNYTWQLISSLNPITQGSAVINGDFLIFMPGVSCRDTFFDIQYKLIGGQEESIAGIHIVVSEYNNPVNVLGDDVKCIENMPSGITFRVHEKFKDTSIILDGFSMPLVGDINGDGKPDIIALGLGRTGNHTSGDNLAGRAWYVHIFDGQTGQRLWSVNFGTEPSSIAYTNVTELKHDGITTNLNEKTDQFQLRFDPRHNSPGHLAIADLDNDGLGEIVVVECGNLGKIYALKPVVDTTKAIKGFTVFWYGNDNGTQYSYKTPINANHEIFGAGIPYITNLNGDSIPEVIVYNKIFDGRTGQIVCVLEALNNFGFPSASNINTIKNNYAYVGRRPEVAFHDDHIPCMVIADINGDDILDIVAGSKVYLMKDNNGVPALDNIIYGPSKITAQRGTNSTDSVTTYVTDGFTAVADIDLDGFLDVIVLTPAVKGMGNATENLLYVWDPLYKPDNAKAAVYLFTKSATGTMSFPFVGDINGRIDSYSEDKYLPEICFNGGRFYTSHSKSSQISFHPLSSADLTDGGITGASSSSGFNYDPSKPLFGHIVGFTYHANDTIPLHQRLKLSWAMEHGDESSCTGITMFDFDDDNIKELCYRDETSVRVIAPALKTYIPLTEAVSPTSAIRFKQSDIRSYTGFEAPVIADVDMDGSADIITLVYPFSQSSGQSKAYIYVFEHASGFDKWAPCPPVWNQAIYFPLQINENLTVPAKPQSMLTTYTDKDGRTIYPYNGQWIQQPIIKNGNDYIPVVRKPDVVVHNMTVKVQTNLKSIVTLTISNQGSASVNSQTPVSFYNGGNTGISISAGAAYITTLPVAVDIFPGEKITHTYELSGNFNNSLIWARLVDDSVSFPAIGYDECDLLENVFSAIDCPDFVYDVSLTNNGILCDTNFILLTATPLNPANMPAYQWYYNDKPINGETQQSYRTNKTGEYKCYVVDGICRGFSSTKKLIRPVLALNNDYASTMGGVQLKIDVLANDQIAPECKSTLSITKLPLNGMAFVVNDSVLYIPNNGFSGIDSFQYDMKDQAMVYVNVYDFPDNINDATCFSNPPALIWSIGDGQKITEKTKHSLYQSVLAGDLDSDGGTEILAAKPSTVNDWLAGYYTNGINIYNMKTSTMTSITTAEYATSDLGPTGIAKSHASDKNAFIVVSSRDGYLYAYNKAGTLQWKSNAKYTDVSPPSNYTYLAGAVAFADFNGDGYAEIYIKDKIFDLETGTLLLDLNDEISAICEMGSTVADLDKDGLLELIIRGKVYKIMLTNRTGTTGNTASLWKEVTNNPHPNAGLMTILVDFDLDGLLEILVNDIKWFYIWDPYTGNVKINQTKTGAYEGQGCPVVGDIDGDGYPEIVYTGVRHLTAWDIDSNATATLKWSINTNDVSGYTGIILFDFNQDGFVEIIYRDEKLLRIINGNNATTVQKDLATIPCTSGTQGEYPVIADVDNDGQAEIVMTGGAANEKVPSAGPLLIFRASTGNKWGPARRVWNQYAYNVVCVNEDLSIPKMPITPSMIFPGKDGMMGTSDDIHPYNAFLQQQTMLNTNGNLLWLLPDAHITNTPALHYYAIGDSLRVVVGVNNIGNAPLNAPFHISLYQNSVTTANKLLTGAFNRVVNVKDTAYFSLTIPKVSSYQSLTTIIIRLNDKGTAVYDQTECDYTNNEIAYIKQNILRAHNDYGITVTEPINIKVLDNDSIPTTCRQSLKMDTVINGGPKNGVLVIRSDTFNYQPETGFYGIDSITYYIRCSMDSAIARVYIIVNKPLNLKYIACPGASINIGFSPLAGVEYYWYNSATGGTSLKKDNTITVTKDANPLQSWWAEPRYNGITFPRYRFDLELSLDCGRTQPAGCLLSGVLLFSEDFGGNSPSDPQTKPAGIPQVEKYTYSLDLGTQGSYTIAKTTKNFKQPPWYKDIDDHTFPNDPSRGYLIGFDASASAGQFYKYQIDGLCAGIKLNFSAWITSLTNNLSYTHKANLIFLVEDMFQNRLAQYYTGDVPDADPTWKNYGFEFTVPSGHSSIILKVINNGAGSYGNDFVLDDIEIRLCMPDISISTPLASDTAICTGKSILISGNYTDNSLYGNDLLYHWEFNSTGDLSEDSNWRIIPNTAGASSDGIVSSFYAIDSLTISHTGHYRLVIGNKDIIDAPKCKARSRLIKVFVDSLPVLKVATDTLLCTMENLNHLVKEVSPNSIIQFYSDSLVQQPLISPLVHIHSDTTFYGRTTNTNTGCISRIASIHIRRGTYPADIPTTGKNKLCINDTILLNNVSIDGGVWSISNPSIIKLIDATPNSVKVVGINTGKAYVSYTTGKSSCQTKVTFQVKVFRKRNTKIIIGIER
ncbi:MAG: FG-GAP-like repeat-containing protein [Bacteroidales bacterium]|jgi:hypothetical protein|nr:FG-GAP-like repeat-containing protein [Bacteroidales bacterium]